MGSVTSTAEVIDRPAVKREKNQKALKREVSPTAMKSSVGTQSWQPHFYYHLSRVLVAVLILFLLLFYPGETRIGIAVPLVLAWLCLGVYGIYRENHPVPGIGVQRHLHMLIDLTVLAVLAAQGLASAVVAVALHVVIIFAALLFAPLGAVVYAILGGLLMLIMLHFLSGREAGDFSGLVHPLITITGVFVAAMAFGFVNRSARSEATKLSENRLRLANLQQINRLMIEKLDVGVAVLDSTLNIRQINESAQGMIGGLIRNDRIAGKLAHSLIGAVNASRPSTITTNVGHGILEINTVPLHRSLLVTVENKTDMALKMRESRLAASGRLASSIAHEIRNPLNAINHAAQLLGTGAPASGGSAEALDDIRNNAQRIDRIVESVLQRSRTGMGEPREIDLQPWLRNFADGYQASGSRTVHFRHTGIPVSIVFDPIQLEQILLNLCRSLIDHSNTVNQETELELHTRIDHLQAPHLELVEHGRPLERSGGQRLFEPFDEGGSDADLYLVREICTINGALVDYFRESLRSGFRISFIAQDNQVVK